MPLMDRIFNMYSDIFYYVAKWFTDLLGATGATGIVLGMITLFLIVRFLISPLAGSGSDKVTKRKKASDE